MCHTGPLYQTSHLACARAIIANRDLRKLCSVTISKHPEATTRVLDVTEDAIIIITWGESLSEHCTSQAGVTHDVPAGTYLATLTGDCTLKNADWSVRGILSKKLSIFKSADIIKLKPINIEKLVPVKYALDVPKKIIPLFPQLGEVASVKISNIGNAEPFHNEQSDVWNLNTVMGFVWGVILLILSFMIVILCTLYFCKERYRKFMTKNENASPSMEQEPVPLLGKYTLQLQPSNLNTKVNTMGAGEDTSIV